MKQQFKAESKRLLELMIHSIYTHKDIFIRELISNASDAIDKLYYKSLKENLNLSDFKIEIIRHKDLRILEIKDNGIGMSKEELIENLGTIAKSDSYQFKQENSQDEVDIIGQFGVGFYAAFMVADKIEVVSKKYGENQGHIWICDSQDDFSVEEKEVEYFGTIIRLYLKENSEDINYDEYLDDYYLKHLVKKYSDYIRYPIEMSVENDVYDEEGKVVSTTFETEVLNSMIPLWKKSKSEIQESEYHEFYQSKFHDSSKPLTTIHTNVEGNVSFNALLFIPSTLPYNYYSNEFKKGLQLYSSGVFINDGVEELVSEHFRFVRGIVDSYDLSLNISREVLQHNRQLNQIAKVIEKKIKTELLNLLKNDRSKYQEFWKIFGSQIKYGVYQDFGMHKDQLVDLLLFYSSKNQELVTLDEYIEGKEEKIIYYASGENINQILKLPQVEALISKDKEILLLNDRIDEFAITMLRSYKEFEFKNVTASDVELLSEDEIKAVNEKTENNKDLLTLMKESLTGKVSDVILSKKLVNHPVCLSNKEGISFEMEKTLNALPNQERVHATKILEINPNHDIFKLLEKLYLSNADLVKKYSDILYSQALLIEGFELENPVEFSQKLCELMVDANK